MKTITDTIRPIVAARAAELNLNPFALSKVCQGVSDDAIRRYFAGETSITAGALSQLMGVLGLRVEVAEKNSAKKRK